MRKLLLLSSSKADQGEFLAHSRDWLAEHLAPGPVLFIPYAAVTRSYADYTAKVAAALAPAGLSVQGLQAHAEPRQAVAEARAILTGGGNTFTLLARLYQQGLIDPLRQAVRAGTPYAGWSAGANIAGPSIGTTNDMPITEPPSFRALNLVPFQLNPHFTEAQPPGHFGETRTQRLTEYMVQHPATTIIGLPEGTGLRVQGQAMKLLGDRGMPVFRDQQRWELAAGATASQWL